MSKLLGEGKIVWFVGEQAVLMRNIFAHQPLSHEDFGLMICNRKEKYWSYD